MPSAKPVVRWRARSRKYGRQVELKSLFAELDSFVTVQSLVYGERDVTILMRVLDVHGKPETILPISFVPAGKLVTTGGNLQRHVTGSGFH